MLGFSVGQVAHFPLCPAKSKNLNLFATNAHHNAKHQGAGCFRCEACIKTCTRLIEERRVKPAV